MLNKKKLEMTFKKYKKNWIEEIESKDSEEEYEEIKNEIDDIIKMNAVEKDHVLLIDLSSISSYYLTKWKNEVLINGGNSIDELKKVQMVVFYQCVGQELYRIRYPNMDLEYDFLEVVTALIHFTMFGWEREENILFNLIVDNLGKNILDVDYPQKHIWFLLELYLRYRNRTIAGESQNVHLAVKDKLKKEGRSFELIPEDLDVYKEALDLWLSPNLEEVKSVIDKMILYHSVLVSDIDNEPEFGDYTYGFYPYEILFLMHIRRKLGLPVPDKFEDLLMNTPEAKVVINEPEPYPEWDPLLRAIDEFYRKNYPNYIPNKHGKLFE